MKKESTAPAWKEPAPSSETEWTIWKDKSFQISYPPKWYATPLEEPNSLVGFFSTKDSKDDEFKEFITIHKTNVVFKDTTAQLGQKTEQFMKAQLPKAKLVSSKLVKINSMKR
jgi:hypothetical protein